MNINRFKTNLKELLKTQVDWIGCEKNVTVEVESQSLPAALNTPCIIHNRDPPDSTRCTRGSGYTLYNEQNLDTKWNMVNFKWSRVSFTPDQRSEILAADKPTPVAASVALNIKVTAKCTKHHFQGVQGLTQYMGGMVLAKLTEGQDPLIAGHLSHACVVNY